MYAPQDETEVGVEWGDPLGLSGLEQEATLSLVERCLVSLCLEEVAKQDNKVSGLLGLLATLRLRGTEGKTDCPSELKEGPTFSCL